MTVGVEREADILPKTRAVPESAKPQYKAAKHYDAAPQLFPEIKGDTLSSVQSRTFCRFVELYEGNEPVVDLGCGTGRVGRHLSAVLRPTLLVSMDLSWRGVELAKHLGAAARSAMYVQGDLLNLPFTNIRYCACHGVVHHTPDPDRAISQLASALAPGAVLYLALYAKSWYSSLYRFGGALRRWRQRGVSAPAQCAFALFFLPRYLLRIIETRSLRHDFNIRASFEDCIMTPYAHFFSDRELRARFQQLALEVIAHERMNYGALHCYVLRKHASA